MDQMTQHGQIGRAAMSAGIDPKTARKYIHGDVPPAPMPGERAWKTRTSPFEPYFAEIEEILRTSPGIDARTIFAVLHQKHGEIFQAGQLRTLQRWVHRWRALNDSHKNVVFTQNHRPGEAAQTDFTRTAELEITIEGQLFTHLLCVFVLPFSNWMWATVVLSESIEAIKRGVQAALFQLHRVPTFHQTDNSTAATHEGPERDEPRSANDPVDMNKQGRRFNRRYLAIMGHFGMTPRTTSIGAKEQNGDVESMNGVLKRRLIQELIVRGSRDFLSVQAWQHFVNNVVRSMNLTRKDRFAKECEAMKELRCEPLQEFVEERVRVTQASTIRLRNVAYSVPSRLIGEELVVRVFESRVQAFYRGEQQIDCERQPIGEASINYRHVIESLLRKPGAVERYCYREHMFPSLIFRRAYDAFGLHLKGIARDVEYIRTLHLAAMTSEVEVELALDLILQSKETLRYDAVKELADSRQKVTPPGMTPMKPDLSTYDQLLARAC